MQIFDTAQIRAWDEYTIANEPVSSVDLMERAARACFEWLISHNYKSRTFSIYCSKGNNGGDGLALARMLANTGHSVSVFILEFGYIGTNDFQANLARLHETIANISYISSAENIRDIDQNDVVIDAILGSGLNRALDGLTAKVVEKINDSGAQVIALDIPTGLFVDKSSQGNTVIRAMHTLTFQCYKLAFLVAENSKYTGDVHILDIGLDPGYLADTSPPFTLIDSSLASELLRSRKKFAHKGNYGHGAVIAGSKGMIGAAALCARAVMRSGAGKVTCHTIESGLNVLQSVVPEAMCKVEKGDEYLKSITSLDKYDAIGIGPGMGVHDSHTSLLSSVFKQYHKPAVVDADALNVIARSPDLLKNLPPLSVITPHPGEFVRLFGKTSSGFDDIQTAMSKAKEFEIIVVLKGAYTFIATPGGMGYFNSSGNPGMATGGTGDVLTGIITGLLCQAYPGEQAAILGVYLHGLAGDIAAKKVSQQSLIASDVIEHLGEAFKSLQ